MTRDVVIGLCNLVSTAVAATDVSVSLSRTPDGEATLAFNWPADRLDGVSLYDDLASMLDDAQVEAYAKRYGIPQEALRQFVAARRG